MTPEELSELRAVAFWLRSAPMARPRYPYRLGVLIESAVADLRVRESGDVQEAGQ